MAVRALAASLFLAFAAATPFVVAADPAPAKAGAAEATSTDTDGEDDAAADKARYERRQFALYDMLVADPSPRMQILAIDVYIPGDDPTPTALRPKSPDVVARAVDFAPDDAFVQWLAARHGNYYGSKCGPMRLPEAEVANLVRLEPDNAGAWQYAVALAQAKGDANGVDEALSRMAASTRADDHVVDELAAWRAAYAAHPDVASPEYLDEESDVAPSDRGWLVAYEHVAFGGPHGGDALQEACTPDADSDRTWRRLGWCADAGRMLAEKGTSLALRANGLAMLKATGEQSDAIEKARLQYDWLAENNANQLAGPNGDVDYAGSFGDWRDAKSEIEAIGHRLKRLGLSSTPPPGWKKQKDDAESRHEDAQAFAKAYADYMVAVFDDMRASASPEARTFATLNNEFVAAFTSMSTKGAPKADTAEDAKAIAAIAQANASNLKVQWMIAAGNHVPDDAKANAIAAVQQAEPDNAAAWALSVAHAAPADPLADTLLERMAASKRYDMHATYGPQALLDAVRRRPMPPELIEMGRSLAIDTGEVPNETLARTLAISAAYMVSMSSADFPDACSTKKAAAGTQRHDTCVAIGQVLIRGGATIMDVYMGESLLTHLGTIEGADAARVRQVKWWHETLMDATPARKMPSEAVLAYMDDYIGGGNEIAALGRFAEKLGKSEPPAGWTPRKTRK